MSRPLRVGLTGGIASGKSLVAEMLRERGAAVVDADRIAREVLAPGGAAHNSVVRAFPDVVRPDGTVDRKALGSRIFADPTARRKLNALTHPTIRLRMAEEAERAAAAPGVDVIVFDIPLLFETTDGSDLGLEGAIVVYADDEVRLRRLATRDGLSEAEARRRLAAQMPLNEKAARANWVVNNTGSPEDTRGQVDHIWATLLERRREAQRDKD
jgi:dephospho-CoA kinase